MANPFDQFDAAPAHPTGNNPFDQFDSHPSASITRAPGATGFGAVAQTFSDLFNPHAGQEHDPNAIEQAILPVANSRPIQSLKANFDQAVDNGLFMEPTRAVMEGLGVGRQPNETNQALHARYNRAITNARMDAQQRAQANTVGAYDGNPLHMAERAAQQVGNVGAGIVANPQYFALPGMGIGNSIAARIGTSAALNAGVGAASDDAAQLMDIAAGQKKDFDIQQNLANTVMGGAAGAALHGAVEVAPFIKSLFADRGRDTTPGAYPLGQTSPITPNQVVMNPAESAQYRQLLASGSVDDIKNFFKGRQGPQPSWQDVNNWVDHRDAAQQSDTVPQHVQDTVQRLLPTDQAIHVQNVTNHVNTITAGWKNAPEIEVVHSPADIADPTIRAQVTAQDPSGDAVGIYGSDGKVRLFSQNIHTPDQASAALFHEGLGHYGLDQQFGDRLNQVMTTLADRNVGQFGKAVDAYQQANPGISRALAAEETLAEASQKGTMKPSWQQAVGTAIKQFGRKMGLNLKYSDGEVNHILAMAHDAVISGKSVRDNGFRGANKYMYVGESARTFPHDEARKAQVSQYPYHNMSDEEVRQAIGVHPGADQRARFEISDHDAHLKNWGDIPAAEVLSKAEEYRLEDVLHHPSLFAAYPELRDVSVTKQPAFLDFTGATQGFFDPKTERINITPNADDPESTLLHEIQHWIQGKEFWSPGGSPSSIRLDNQSAIRKLNNFYNRKYASIEAEGNALKAETGEENPTSRSMLRVLDRKIDLTRNLLSENSQTKAVYDKMDEADARVKALKSQMDSIKAEHTAKADKLRSQFDQLSAKYKELADEKRYEEASIVHKERMAIEFPKYEELKANLKPIEDQLATAKEDHKTAVKEVNSLKDEHNSITHDLYSLIAGEREARDVQQRQILNEHGRLKVEPYSLEGIHNDEVIHMDNTGYAASSHPLGYEGSNPDELNEVDRLKTDPRYWSDPEYRANVNEMARTQFPAEHGTNKFMRRQSDDNEHGRLPITEQDIAINRRLRGMIKLHDDPNGFNRFSDIDNIRERYAREYGDVPDEQVDRIAQEWKNMEVGQKHPDLAENIPVYFKGNPVTRVDPYNPNERIPHTFPNRREAMAWIDQHNNAQHYGVDRYGTDLKFATRAQIASTGIARKDFVPADLEGMATHITMNYDREANEQPIAITRELAFRAGIEPNDIKLLAAQHPGELAARVARIGAAADLASTRIKDILTKFDTPEWTSQHHFDLASAIADRNYLVERFKEESGAIGRALNVTKIFRSMTNGNIAAVMERLREEGSGLASLADPTNPDGLKFARQLKEALENNPDKAQNLMTNVNKPYWEQYLTTFHMNMMLSALSTHFKAPIDMGTGIARNVIEKVVAMPIGKVRQMFEAMTGKTVQPGVEIAELSNHLQGMMDAVTTAEVYRQSLVALRTGQSSYVLADKGGIGAASPQVVPTNFANQFGAISNPRFKGAAGVLNKPMDAVSAQDTFFRSVEMNAQLGTLGAREAREELGPGASTRDVMARGRYWAQNPTPTMLRDAFEETNRTLLLNDNPINRIVNRARLYRPGMNVGQRAMAWFANNLAPFIRVESNSLINRVIQRSPLAILDPTGYTQAQLKAGGAKADIALSKMIYGTFLMGMMWTAAAKGKDYLTGQGDSNVQRYKEDIAAGRVPNAVHENGRFTTGGQLGMSINPFDMHNKTAQMVAGMRQAWDAGANQGQVGTGFMLAAGALFHDLAESSWVSDLTPAMDAITAHGEQGSNVVSNFVANEAKTFVPNLSNQIARKTDVQRDTTVDGSQAQKVFGHISNELESTVPGLRENLPVKYSVYGNPLPTGASMTGVHTMIPGLSGNGTTETIDPAERELDRLNVILPDLKAPTGEPDLPKTLVTGVSRSIKVDGQKRQLNPAEFEEYQHRAGRHIVEDVRQEMSTPEWQNMSDYDRVLTVRQIESDQKANAKEELFGQ